MAEKAIDYVVAISIFSITFAFVAMISINYPGTLKSDVVSFELKSDLFKVTEIIIKSTGEPTDWDYSTPSVLGLAYYDTAKNRTIEYALSKEKVLMLNSSRLDYLTARDALGLEKDFTLSLKSISPGWWNSSFMYRKAILVNAPSGGNISTYIEFPRGHAYSTTLRVVNASDNLEVPFEVVDQEYYDPYYNWTKRCNVSFEVGAVPGTQQFYIYYTDNLSIPSSASVLGLIQSVTDTTTGKEEINLDYPSYGIQNLMGKDMAVASRVVSVQEEIPVAYIYGSSYEVDLLRDLGYHFDVYTASDIGQLFNYSAGRNLFKYRMVIAGTHAAFDSSAIRNNLTANQADIFDFVNLGGTLAVLGQDASSTIDGYGWLYPFGINGSLVSGTNQTVLNFSLKAVRFPNNLSRTYTGSNDSIYLSVNRGANSHPTSPAYTYWSVPRMFNITDYGIIRRVVTNRTEDVWFPVLNNEDFNTDLSSWTVNHSKPLPADQATVEWVNTGRSGGSVHVDYDSNDNETADIYQDVYLEAWPVSAALNFSYNVYDFNPAPTQSDLTVLLTHPNGTVIQLYYLNVTGTTGWVDISIDITDYLTVNGTYRVALQAYGQTGAGQDYKLYFDDITINATYVSTIWLIGEIGGGKIAVSGDEPHYTGHDRMIQNMLEWGSEKERFVRHLYELVLGVW